MPTITKGATTITPTLVQGYSARRPSRTIAHEIIGKEARDYSLAAAAPRSGTLELFFAEYADAWACFTLHAEPGPFTFANLDHPATDMVYVVDEGADLQIELDPETLRRWLVQVPYAEAAP